MHSQKQTTGATQHSIIFKWLSGANNFNIYLMLYLGPIMNVLWG